MSNWGRDDSSMMGLRRVLGDALQAAYLVESHVELEPTEVETLRRAARLVNTVEAFTDKSRSYAVPPSAIDLMTASEGITTAQSIHDLRDHLQELAVALEQMAEGNKPNLGLGVVIDRLKNLHAFAHAATSRVLDEVH